MMKTLPFYMLFISVLFSCNQKQTTVINEQDSIEYYQGAIINMPYFWKTQLTDGYQTQGKVHKPIQYKGGVLVLENSNDSLYFVLLDAKTGAKRWKAYRPKLMDGDLFDAVIEEVYQKDNELLLFTYEYLQRGIEKIDLETGETVWSYHLPDNVWAEYGTYIQGTESFFVFAGSEYSEHTISYEANAVYKGNLQSGEIEYVCKPRENNLERNDSLFLDLVAPVRIQDTLYFFVAYSFKFQTNIGLFNVDLNKWVYDSLVLKGKGVSPSNVIEGERFYISTSEGPTYSGDILSGNMFWESEDLGLPYGGIIGNKSIYGSRRGADGAKNIMAVNKTTGKTEWIDTKEGPEKFMEELNGIIYFTSGYLYAIDAETGEKYWHLDPPDGSRFSECTVVPGKNGEKGRIVGVSSKAAYCYEAIR